MSNANIRNITELLESDDEFPDVYDDEVPDIPAYKLDNRFDAAENIQFPWIEHSTQIKQCGAKQQEQSSLCRNTTEDIQPLNIHESTMYNINTAGHSENQDRENIKQYEQSINHEIKDEKILIRKGVLSKQDIFCLQHIGAVATDATLMWFINFLMYKDLQSNYKFLKSCLVLENLDDACTTKYKSVGHLDVKKFNFNIVVKM